MFYLPIIFLFVALDQLTKLLVLYSMPLYGSIKIVPRFFNLTHLYNTGAAFGMMHDSNRFFIIVSCVALVLLIWQRRRFTALPLELGWVLIISGILGNLCDRLLRGHVIDFLDFQLLGYHWPAFNVADACICIATAYFLISAFTSQPSK